MSYSYTVQYKPGHSIPVADTLSRLPLTDTTAAETDSDDVVALVTDAAADVLTEDVAKTKTSVEIMGLRHCEYLSLGTSGRTSASRSGVRFVPKAARAADIIDRQKVARQPGG